MSLITEIVKYGVFIAIIVIGGFQIYKKMIATKFGGKRKWEDFLDD